jgi:Tol biopolymer transport system component
MTLAAGSRLGPYELLSPLGAGGMGEVWRARDTRLSREVAIKVLPAGVSSDPDRLRRFEKEARSASSLNHPNIVTIHDIGQGPSGSYIAMELVEGETLRELLSEGPLQTRRLLSIAAQVADGLAKAHGAGIIHRDLKPENVMVTRDGFVKILDFGLAKLTQPERSLDATGREQTAAGQHPMAQLTPTAFPTETRSPSLTEPGLVMGTVGYMSPEQARGKPLDFHTDQFSFGSLLYEMATGRRAFARESTPETLSAIIREEPEPIAALAPVTPPPLRWIVERCLAKNPEDRYASTRDLARDLTTIREHLSETSGGIAAAAISPPRSGPRAAALVVVAVLALAAGIFLAPLFGRGRKSPLPRWQQASFRRGMIWSGRFAPDGQTIVYSAAWDGGAVRLFTTRPNSTETLMLDLPPGKVLSISPRGELAFLRDPRFIYFFFQPGTLARSSLEGAAARDLLENVVAADWSPDGAQLAVVRLVPGKNRLEYPIGRPLYETDGTISSVRLSRDGAWIAFFEHRTDTAAVVAVRVADRTRQVLSDGWSVSSGGLAWSPDGREVWFTPRSLADKALPLFAVSLSGKTREVATIPGTLNLLDVARDGRVLLARSDHRLGIRASGSFAGSDRDLSWLDNGFLGDLSEDGRTIVFADHDVLFLRRTDGSPAVRLGEPYRFGLNRLSPDGRWVLTMPGPDPPMLVLVPTGAGEIRRLDRIPPRSTAQWLPDGRRLLCLSEGRDGKRLLVFDLQSGEMKGLTVAADFPLSGPDPVPSRDGTRIAAVDGKGEVHVQPLAGGEETRVPGAAGYTLIGWAEDGRHLYLYRIGDVPARVQRLDLGSGKTELWKQLSLEDLAGVIRIHPISVTPDGRSWAYSYARVLSDLYVAQGLR